MKRILGAWLAGVVAAALAGCATDTSKLPRFQSSARDEQAIRERMADDDFPDAKEVGLGEDAAKPAEQPE